MLNKSEQMHHADIRAALTKQGCSLVGFDRKNDWPEGTTHSALHTGRPTAERALSRFLETPLHILWPDRYMEDGTRIILRGRQAWDPKCNASIKTKSRSTHKANA